MSEILLGHARELRRVAERLERAATAEKPPSERVIAMSIKYMRHVAKDAENALNDKHIRTGNGYKAALDRTERQIRGFADDIEKWTEAGIEPWWAEEKEQPC